MKTVTTTTAIGDALLTRLRNDSRGVEAQVRLRAALQGVLEFPFRHFIWPGVGDFLNSMMVSASTMFKPGKWNDSRQALHGVLGFLFRYLS